ncbi:MAG TPA: GNAT family N-acetyltransferase [Mycobacteriales bacterium]|nr:GNAT family N-acetyltransferase [Mycobacteriales bacterium]
MPSAPIDDYVEAFVARCAVEMVPQDAALESAGVWGVTSGRDKARIRLLVTDDRAYDRLAALLPGAQSGSAQVVEKASRCVDLLRGSPGWNPERPATAMIHHNLWSLPRPALPSGLTLRPVRRRSGDAFDGVLLEDAAALAVLADPGITDPPDALADYLRSLAPKTRLLAAIDDSGAVRATSGSGVFGHEASVLFVNTDPSWRGRGIARAMTAAALRVARSGGARRASLVATDAGAPLYRRLGFQAAGTMTRFFRQASTSSPPTRS